MSKRLLARKCIVRFIGERPGHIPRVLESTAAESPLNRLYRHIVLVAEHAHPSLVQATVERRRRKGMGAEQRDDNGRVDEDERVGDDDDRRASLVSAGQTLAAFEKYARDNGQERRGAGEDVGDGNGEAAYAGEGIARHCRDGKEPLN